MTPPRRQFTPNDGLVVYGLGATGQTIVDELIDKDVPIELILDRGKRGQEHRGIPIRALDEVADGGIAGKTVLIGLHNHYVDVKTLDRDLREAGAAEVLTPINLPQLVGEPRTKPGYWLDSSFDYAAHHPDFDRLRGLLADEASRDLLDLILRYRQSGSLADCPPASLTDEYTPADLPRYAGPLRVVDCGAFTGVAIHKLLGAGYTLDTVVAFEPDPASFATLASRNFPANRTLCLPLGTWSSTTQLRFASDGSMGSALSDTGEVTIQCVAIDDVLHGEPVNLVKLDVEGAEIETLKGMERIVRAQKPNLLLSAYHTPGHLYEIADLIAGWELGYRFHLRVHEYNTFGVVLYCLRDELLET
ncbi:MAG: FkbM family methyltransferase [Sphingomonadales bacterium]|nr:FkbM family methyltransferase [Sphingomonadales bacterium]